MFSIVAAVENKELVRRFYAEAINGRDLDSVDRHHAPFLGVDASGRSVSFTSTAILRVRDGLIAEAWDEVDIAGLLQRIRPAPAP